MRTDTVETVRTMFAHDCEFAEKTIIARGRILPMFCVHFEHQGELSLAMVMGDFSDTETKQRSVQVVRMIGVAVDAFAISLISEAWVATVDRNTDQEIADLAPADREDRREVVMVTLSSRHKLAKHSGDLVSTREILRGADGAVSGLGPDTTDAHGDFGGRMSQLVAPRRPSPEARATAALLLDRIGVKIETHQRH